MEFKVIHINETDSTNGWLREFATDEHGMTQRNDIGDVRRDFHEIPCHSDANVVVVAEYQTAGRGCGSNTWESERGKNLTFSVLLHPTEIPANSQFRITEVVSVAMCETLEHLFRPLSPSDSSPDSGEQEVTVKWPHEVTIKWPNDIYVGDRKICGILIENRLKGSTMTDSIVGIGLNVNQRTFVSDAPNPVSVYQLTGEETDREALLQMFLKELSKTLEMNPEPLAEAYRSRLYRREGIHRFSDSQGEFEAKVQNVLDDGRFVLLDTHGKTRIYSFKEVQFGIKETNIFKGNELP